LFWLIVGLATAAVQIAIQQDQTTLNVQRDA